MRNQKTKINFFQFCSQKLQLIQYVRDLFEAGTETTTSTLRWCILCFLHHPQAQQKFYEEVIKNMGMDIFSQHIKISFHFIVKNTLRQRFGTSWLRKLFREGSRYCYFCQIIRWIPTKFINRLAHLFWNSLQLMLFNKPQILVFLVRSRLHLAPMCCCYVFVYLGLCASFSIHLWLTLISNGVPFDCVFPEVSRWLRLVCLYAQVGLR